MPIMMSVYASLPLDPRSQHHRSASINLHMLRLAGSKALSSPSPVLVGVMWLQVGCFGKVWCRRQWPAPTVFCSVSIVSSLVQAKKKEKDTYIDKTIREVKDMKKWHYKYRVQLILQHAHCILPQS